MRFALLAVFAFVAITLATSMAAPADEGDLQRRGGKRTNRPSKRTNGPKSTTAASTTAEAGEPEEPMPEAAAPIMELAMDAQAKRGGHKSTPRTKPTKAPKSKKTTTSASTTTEEADA